MTRIRFSGSPRGIQRFLSPLPGLPGEGGNLRPAPVASRPTRAPVPGASGGGAVGASALLAKLGGDVLDHAAGLAVGGRELGAGDAPALHPVLHRLPLREVEPVLVDETPLVLESGHFPNPRRRCARSAFGPSVRAGKADRLAP